jgi:hypothetical protein
MTFKKRLKCIHSGYIDSNKLFFVDSSEICYLVAIVREKYMNWRLTLIVLAATFTNLVNVGIAFSQDSLVFNAGTTFVNTSVDQEMSLIDLLDSFKECKKTPKPKRGEYETKNEYKARVSRESVDCDSLIKFSGFLDAPVSLNYDVDTEMFHFYLQFDANWYPDKGTEIYLRPINRMDYPYPDEEHNGKDLLDIKPSIEEMRKRNTHPVTVNKTTINGKYFKKLLVDSFTHEFAVDEYWLKHRRLIRPMWDLFKLDFKLLSTVDRAKALKVREGGLVWRIKFNYNHYGVFNKPTAVISEIEIIDTESVESLFKLSL